MSRIKEAVWLTMTDDDFRENRKGDLRQFMVVEWWAVVCVFCNFGGIIDYRCNPDSIVMLVGRTWIGYDLRLDEGIGRCLVMDNPDRLK